MTMISTIEDARQHPLWDTQAALEGEMRSLGIERFRNAVETAREGEQETRIAPIRRMMFTTHTKMVEAVEAFMAECQSGKAGRKHSAYPYFEGIGNIDMIAHLTVRIILDNLTTRRTLTHVAVMIAEALEDECNYRDFKAQHVAGYLSSMSRARRKGNVEYRRKSVLSTAKKLSVNLQEWPKRDMVLVGTKLVEMFAEVTGLIRLNHQFVSKNKSAIYVEIAPESREFIDKELSRTEWLAPMYMPMVIPPRPWTSPFDGGYWTSRSRRLTLVKSPSKAYLEELRNQDMPTVYDAVNALQDTAWSINLSVLGVMENLWDNRSTRAIIPQVDDTPLPQKPLWLVEGMKKEDMSEEQLEEFKRWKRECVFVRDTNARMIGKRVSFSRMLWVANKFRENDMHFPYQLDWRGRAYPVALYLQPQGDDAQRGLLEFSSSAAIADADGAMWLAIHGAGCWGVDKASFEKRHQWVLDNETRILACASDPYENGFWMEAEKPWCALAFCFDWAGFKREGYAYESSLPVQMDGTCNGLQNFSAILLDEIGGAAVNLIPAETPQDIYQRVADVVAAKVEADLANETRVQINRKVTGADGATTTTTVEGPEIRTLAAAWAGLVTRKVVKRPVMTLAYGASRYGFIHMVFGDTLQPWKTERPADYPFGAHGWEAAQYLGDLIWRSVGEIVVAASEAMKWLQEAAKVVSGEKLPINWVTPSGLLVQQAYRLRDMTKIELAFQSVRIRLDVDQGCLKLDSKKQAAGISPNWVHSLDASHMMRTICASTCAGVRSYSMIHDSYGTHAGNCALLGAILREEFVRMYSETDVLADFKADLEAALPEGVTLPELPPKGTLDLQLVLESQFFFA